MTSELQLIDVPPRTAEFGFKSRSDAKFDGAGSFELVTDLQAMAELEADWNALFERMKQRSNPFLAFNWNWLWCKHYLADKDAGTGVSLCVVVGRRKGTVDMIWPLLLTEKCGLRKLSFMGAPVSQYADVLIDDGPVKLSRLIACWDYVRRHLAPDVFVARKVRADSAIAPFFNASTAIVTNQDEAPYAELSAIPDFETFRARFSKRLRKNIRRQTNRLAEHGAIEFKVLDESSQAGELVGTAIDMKSEWLRQNGHISPGFSDPRYKAFFQDAASAVDQPSGCMVSLYSLDGRPLAIEVGVLSKGHYSAHIGAFDQEFSTLSPGTQQMNLTIEYLLEQGSKTYDLLAPMSDYKRIWTDASIGVGDYALATSLRGRVFALLYLKWARPIIKSALTALSNRASRFRLTK